MYVFLGVPVCSKEGEKKKGGKKGGMEDFCQAGKKKKRLKSGRLGGTIRKRKGNGRTEFHEGTNKVVGSA